jgi:hypothetical protein
VGGALSRCGPLVGVGWIDGDVGGGDGAGAVFRLVRSAAVVAVADCSVAEVFFGRPRFGVSVAIIVESRSADLWPE